jgi:hypothetical protein
LCEVCGNEDTRTLEVHHIQERASATNGLLKDGTPVHAPSNLKVLCATCHDAQHGTTGATVATGATGATVATTTAVAVLLEKSKYCPKPKRGEEELAIIHMLLKEYKTASPKALVYQLKTEHDIIITAQALAAIRKVV